MWSFLGRARIRAGARVRRSPSHESLGSESPAQAAAADAVGPGIRVVDMDLSPRGSWICVTTWASPGPRPADSERPLGPRPRGKEDNKSLENNAGSGSRARPALGINICYAESRRTPPRPAAFRLNFRVSHSACVTVSPGH